MFGRAVVVLAAQESRVDGGLPGDLEQAEKLRANSAVVGSYVGHRSSPVLAAQLIHHQIESAYVGGVPALHLLPTEIRVQHLLVSHKSR